MHCTLLGIALLQHSISICEGSISLKMNPYHSIYILHGIEIAMFSSVGLRSYTLRTVLTRICTYCTCIVLFINGSRFAWY